MKNTLYTEKIEYADGFSLIIKTPDLNDVAYFERERQIVKRLIYIVLN